eukprot:766794-Hanusia_phi.AAC.5
MRHWQPRPAGARPGAPGWTHCTVPGERLSGLSDRTLSLGRTVTVLRPIAGPGRRSAALLSAAACGTGAESHRLGP